MVVFRISDFPQLDGQGGILFEGRFNFKGTPIIYTSESVALAYYEISVHKGSPAQFPLNIIDFPKKLAIKKITLPENWVDNIELTQKLGSDWVKSLETPILKVPSSLFPHSYNFLINPNHPAIADFTVKSERAKPNHRLLPLKDAEIILKKQNTVILLTAKTFNGSSALAYQWLGLPQLGLKGKIPQSMMQTLEGLRELEEYLKA